MKKVLIIFVLLMGIFSNKLGGTNIKFESNELIKFNEGFISSPLPCQGGKLTIGYGLRCLYTNCERVVDRQTAEVDMINFLEKYVRPKIKIKRKLTKNQQIAIEDQVYRLGQTFWRHSKLKKCVEADNDKCVEKEMMSLVYYSDKNGKRTFSQGLYNRQKNTLSIYLTKEQKNVINAKTK